MIAPADPRPDDHLDALVKFRVDPDAAPGNVIPVLARLLIQLAEKARLRGESGDTLLKTHPPVHKMTGPSQVSSSTRPLTTTQTRSGGSHHG
jgi:hypothetical protein